VIRAALVLALVAAGGCKKTEQSAAVVDTFNVVFGELRGFREEMCRCWNADCASSLYARIEPQIASAERRAPNRTSAQQKDYLREAEKLASCMTTAMTPPTSVPSTPRTPVPAIPPGKGPLPDDPTAPVTIEKLVTSARLWARNEDERLDVVDLEVFYIDDSLVLDPDSGRVTIELGPAPVAPDDDPKRRTGAPIKPRSTDPLRCAEVSWTPSGRWKYEVRGRCRVAERPLPRCTVAEIWKRALAKGAPADALAVLVLRETSRRAWSFKITDEPRNVSFSQSFLDDCEVVVEAR